MLTRPGRPAALDRELWWSVWWPWLLVWGATFLAVVVAVVAVALAWRRRRRFATARVVPGITFYLHEKSVMDLYQSGGYGDALRKEVEERVGSTSDGAVALKVREVGVGGGRTREREVVSRYISDAEPISVIGVLLDVLESADGVVHVDLRHRTVLRNDALAQALGDRAGAAEPRLREIDAYVSVRGVFRLADPDQQVDGKTVFLAPFGDPDDPAQGPQVRIECHREGLRDEIPQGPFRARCLGKVQSWKAADGVLVLRPIAVFQ